MVVAMPHAKFGSARYLRRSLQQFTQRARQLLMGRQQVARLRLRKNEVNVRAELPSRSKDPFFLFDLVAQPSVTLRGLEDAVSRIRRRQKLAQLLIREGFTDFE